MNDPKTEIQIEWLDTRAFFNGEKWESEVLDIADALNSTLPPEGFSASDPHPHASAVKLAQAFMPEMKVITMAPPYDEEEGPVL